MDENNNQDIGYVHGYVNDEKTYIHIDVHKVIPQNVKIGKWKKYTNPISQEDFWARDITIIDKYDRRTVFTMFSEINPRTNMKGA